MLVYSDTTDLKGFELLDQTGKFWPSRIPNSGTSSYMELLYGPIVGFRALTKTIDYGSASYEKVPIYMSVIYDTCACSMSSFRASSPPEDMMTNAPSADVV